MAQSTIHNKQENSFFFFNKVSPNMEQPYPKTRRENVLLGRLSWLSWSFQELQQSYGFNSKAFLRLKFKLHKNHPSKFKQLNELPYLVSQIYNYTGEGLMDINTSSVGKGLASKFWKGWMEHTFETDVKTHERCTRSKFIQFNIPIY